MRSSTSALSAAAAALLTTTPSLAIPRDDVVRDAKPPEAEPPPLPEGRPPEARVGFQAGLRTGAAIPVGRVAQGPGNAMADAFSAQVPLQIDLGYKPLPQLFVGVYAGAGFGSAGEGVHVCDCAASTLRAGLQSMVSLLPEGRYDPWLGIGIGYESTGFSGEPGTVSLSGFELLHLMGGLDIRSSRGFGFGPYVDGSIGMYTSALVQGRVADGIGALVPGRAEEVDIDRRALHAWITFGVRAVFAP